MERKSAERHGVLDAATALSILEQASPQMLPQPGLVCTVSMETSIPHTQARTHNLFFYFFFISISVEK